MTQVPSRWGADDERGALNLITEESVLSALAVPVRGHAYSLGIPVQHSGTPHVEYRGAPQRLTLSTSYDEELWSGFGAAEGSGANEDVLVMAAHNGTHMDALSHFFADGHLYNGFPADSYSPHSGAARCGIEKTRSIIARGVLLDAAAAAGERWLEPGFVVDADLLLKAEKAAGVTIEQGDVVLVRTGWMEYFWSAQEAGEAVPFEQPGIGVSAGDLLVERDIALVGGDNWAVECMPDPDGVFLPVHRELQVNHGIQFVENLDLSKPAADGATVGLFITSPLSITGGTGSPVNPILVV